MSRSVLDLPTYHSAADQLLQANHYAAGGYGSLTRGLADGAAMAGDDATSEEFADAYDDAAREAVAAYADLVASFTTLGRLVARSADNHGRADVASALGSAEPFDPADPPSLLGGPVVVDLDEPPSSVGGESSAPALWDLVADQLEGWVWPDADVDRLRSIAGVWRQAAASLRVLPTYCDAAVGALGEQVSPEIPLAVEAVSDLAVSPELLALSCDQLGTPARVTRTRSRPTATSSSASSRTRRRDRRHHRRLRRPQLRQRRRSGGRRRVAHRHAGGLGRPAGRRDPQEAPAAGQAEGSRRPHERRAADRSDPASSPGRRHPPPRRGRRHPAGRRRRESTRSSMARQAGGSLSTGSRRGLGCLPR